MTTDKLMIACGGGTGSGEIAAHSLRDWNRLLDRTAAVTMQAESSPRAQPEPEHEPQPGKVQTLCMVQPAPDHFRMAAKRDAGAAQVLNALAEKVYAKRREAAK